MCAWLQSGMSIFKTVGDIARTSLGAVGTARGLALAAYDVYSQFKATRGKPPDKPGGRPWTSPHHWIEYPGDAVVRVPVPRCFHCQVAQTPSNMAEICSGPPGWK